MATLEQIFALTALSLARQCKHHLLRGPCVHVRSAPVIEYTYCGDKSCAHPYALDQLHRHSHTWQSGDARYEAIDGKLLDMETGEVKGFCHFGTKQVVKDIRDNDERIDPRKVLEMYGFDLTEVHSKRAFATPPGNCAWHYESATTAIGVDSEGHDVEFSFETGETSRIYSQNQRAKAVRIARNQGPSVAAKACGIPVETVRTWSKRSK